MAATIITDKFCGKCKEVKPRAAFFNDRGRPDGLDFYCKACVKTYYGNHKREALMAERRARRIAQRRDESDALFTAEELAAEIWRPIPGFEGIYEVSTLARFLSLLEEGSGRTGGIMRPHLNKRWGRWYITLYKDGRACQGTVAKWVALAFLGPRPKGLDVSHIDQNKTHDRPNNLRYLPRDKNIQEAVDADIMGSQSERHWKVRTSNEDVREIRRRYEAGQKQYELAAEYGITQSGVSLIVRRITRKHA